MTLPAILPTASGYEIVLQGNEPEMVGDFALMLRGLYDVGADKEETTATLMSFGHTVPPLKDYAGKHANKYDSNAIWYAYRNLTRNREGRQLL